MLQRIQTIYLLAIVVLSGFVVFSPLADLINKVDNLIYIVDFKGISLVQQTGNAIVARVWGLNSVSLVIPILALITIFSFKNRPKQIRLTVINMVFMISFYFFLIIYLWPACERLHTDWHLRIVNLFPLVNLILSFLAIGAIGKDEKLVKSLDRLR
jgi:cbb3-type cytochrome oxidase subunit 1